MPGDRTRPGKTAGELIRELEADPKWLAAQAERDRVRSLQVRANLAELAPLDAELRRYGIDVADLVMVQAHLAYEEVIPILMKWLTRVSRHATKKAIARALTSPRARPQAASVLLDEFRRTNDVGQRSMGDGQCAGDGGRRFCVRSGRGDPAEPDLR